MNDSEYVRVNNPIERLGELGMSIMRYFIERQKNVIPPLSLLSYDKCHTPE